MFGGEGDAIYGVSQSCYRDFGIPASLANGEHPDFTIESIFPAFHEHNPENLKAQGGVICTLDTTLLPQNFLIEQESESFVSSDDHSEKDLE